MTRDELTELTGDDDLLFADGFDDCIIGVTEYQPGRLQLVVYDAQAMLRQLVEKDGLTEEDAAEHLSFNTFGAWAGERTPVYVNLGDTPCR